MCVYVCVGVCVCEVLIAKDFSMFFSFSFRAGASCPMHVPDATKLWCIGGREG